MIGRRRIPIALCAALAAGGCRGPVDQPVFLHGARTPEASSTTANLASHTHSTTGGIHGITASPIEPASYDAPSDGLLGRESVPVGSGRPGSILGSVDDHAPWPLTLDDARRLALENNKQIAVIGYVPREAATLIQTECGAFDPVFGFDGNWVKGDRQVANRIESFGATSTTQLQEYFRPGDVNQVYLQKKIDTGGTLEIGHSLDYLRLRPVDSFVLVNPAFRSALNFGLTQPLFKGRGRAVTRAPLMIARANRDLEWHTFEANVRLILRDVELAYWDVFRADRDIQTRQRVVDQAKLTFDRESERLRVGEGSVPDVAQAEEQFQAFRIEMASIENERMRAERTLRRLIGLSPEDGRRINPTTEPLRDAPEIDWEEAVAYSHARPEVAAQYAAIEAAEFGLVRARNGLEPDVSVMANYAVTGLADRYDDSWQVVGDNKFNDWTVGMVYRQPLGKRSEFAALRRAEMGVSRERAKLAEVEHEIVHDLHAVHQQVMFQHNLVEMHAKRIKAAALTLEARRALYNDRRATLDMQLEAEERNAIAALDETLAVVDYQKALVRWAFASGMILEDNVEIQGAQSPEAGTENGMPMPGGTMPADSPREGGVPMAPGATVPDAPEPPSGTTDAPKSARKSWQFWR